MEILYLTALENTVNNDIHTNQIFGLSGNGICYKYLFISPKFILNRKGLSVNRNRFHQDDTIEVKIPILSYHLCMHVFIIPYFLIIALPPFIRHVQRIRPDVVHCRNMVSTLLALVARLFTKSRYKVICDPRSVYVEECVITKTFRYGGFNYRIWKSLEKWIYMKADACIGLSEYFKDYLAQFNKHSYFIPAIVNDMFIYDQAKRDDLRIKLGLCNNDVVFCYTGSIDLWHSADKLIYYLDKFKGELAEGYNFKFVFLSGNSKVCKILIDKFKKYAVKVGRVAPNEVLDYLLISDYGIVPGSDNSGDCYDLLYKTMISSKAEEFLVAGLPIIVNNKISSLLQLVRLHNAGLSADETLLPLVGVNRKQISSTFVTMFGRKNVVDKLKYVYNLTTR